MPCRLTQSAVLFLLLSAGIAAQSDVFAALGTTQADAQTSFFSTLATGIPALTGQAATFKAATAQQRVVMVRAVATAARAFASSAEFGKRYALYRSTQQPALAEGARSGDEARAEQQKHIAEAIRQAQAMAGQIPADARKEMEASIADMQKQIAELNADPEHRAAVDQAAKQFAMLTAAEHTEQLAAFESQYPADANTLIVRRLQQFLDVCGDVAFEAKLQQGKDKKFRFVDPALEAKPAEWKMCYRAGKPAVDAARVAAQDWLKAIAR
ncbi:MAG TPA: hypothetical protein VNJ02_04045 [Vicinamibacterales bacterium]|nr:hypothetical protein [Vicinamibacterales bacterium]